MKALQNVLMGDLAFFQALIYSLIGLIILLILRLATKKLFCKKCEDVFKDYKRRKYFNNLYLVIYIISLLFIWYKSSSDILAFLGIFSAGLAIAMKDVIINSISGFYILSTKPFQVGQRIEVAGQIGDVIDIGFFEFKLLEVGHRMGGEQSTGRIVHLPNAILFSSPLANYDKGFQFIWNEQQVSLSLDSNWELAKVFFYEILQRHILDDQEEAKEQIASAGSKYLIYYNNLDPIIYTEVKDGKIVFFLRYLCKPRQRRTLEHLIWEDILKEVRGRTDIHLV
ncbi:mechanosensitive ion channel protein MscS [Sporanaerobium hydrogeniformans]|uniref:Mechanosensitive ion channel protein MscS n=1 Tax=Sporanaerobium hydrogeniformans TaxID=3072179 RepID=A0AC61DES8_9FIRM|nr:mechanosensitive ion channel domain-containing protein [Sporanaerobium hydrogeniformans]PHV71715.1 mechanosensitive ion channel protein MscS [Sporanaerobium hydrogeniformans]